MKKILFVTISLFAGTLLFAQTKNEKALRERTYLLSHTVFGTKDKATLENLFAKKATYGHSSGKIETREEAIEAASQNPANYSDTSLTITNILVNKKTAIVRAVFKANQNNPDGKVAPLNLHILLVWVKESGKWRLMARQAVKLT